MANFVKGDLLAPKRLRGQKISDFETIEYIEDNPHDDTLFVGKRKADGDVFSDWIKDKFEKLS